MELLAYTIVLNFPETIPYLPGIQTETVKFLVNVPNAMLISDNLTSWKNVKFPFLLSLRNFDTPTKQTTHAYIIDQRDRKLPQKALSALPTNTNTRFVFIITEENSLFEMPPFCHVLVLMITDNDLSVTVSVDHCKGIGSMTTKGHDCKANVTFLDLPPNVIFDGEKLQGTEGKMLQAAADQLGFEFTYTVRAETEWGHFDPPSGLLGDIATGNSLLAFGGLYGFIERFEHADFIFGEVMTVLSWAVPHGLGPSQPTWYIILVTELSPFVWGLTLFTYAFLSPIAHYFKESLNEKSSVPLNILGLILGCSQKLILKRRVSLNILIFGFLLTSYYRTMMSSKLTVPTKTPSIRTTKELVDSGLELFGPRTAVSYVAHIAKASPEDAAKAAVTKKYQPTDLAVPKILENIAEKRTSAYLRHEDYMNFIAEKNPRIAGKIHIVEEPFTTYFCVAMIQKHSCLADRIKDIYQHLREAGLSTKWIKDLTSHRKTPNSKTPRKLALEHVKGMLFLLLFGWIASIVTFAGEQVYFDVSKRKNRNK